MKKLVIIGLWLLLLVFLFGAAQFGPILENKTRAGVSSYLHPEDNYSLSLSGSWQIAKVNKKHLLLVNVDYDTTISCTLEVGGYDYLPPQKVAQELSTACRKKLQDYTLITKPQAKTVNHYESANFLARFSRGKDVFYQEELVIQPAAGIRLYVTFLYPTDCHSQIVTEGKRIIESINFFDAEDLYAKYM